MEANGTRTLTSHQAPQENGQRQASQTTRERLDRQAHIQPHPRRRSTNDNQKALSELSQLPCRQENLEEVSQAGTRPCYSSSDDRGSLQSPDWTCSGSTSKQI